MSHRRCVLIGAGTVSDSYMITSLLNADDYVICADGGYINAKSMGIAPNLILGDFDSSPVPNELVNNVKRFKPDKDQSDMHLALLEGLSMGFNNFLIIGATGSRLDHVYANIQLLAYADKQDAFAAICNEKNRIFMVSNKTVALKKETGKFVSVFAYGGQASGVTLDGFKFPLKDATLTTDNPIGVSNEIINFTAKITVEQGTVIVIVSQD